MKVRLQESSVIDSIVLSLWNIIFRKQNSSLSSEDQFDVTNSDAASRNRESNEYGIEVSIWFVEILDSIK